MTLVEVAKYLASEGIEIFQIQAESIQIAERHRYHLMDSGVAVTWNGNSPSIVLVARSQLSSHRDSSPEILFDMVTSQIGKAAKSRGYEEKNRGSREIADPVDSKKILDVWFEVFFEKAVPQQELLSELQWALGVNKTA